MSRSRVFAWLALAVLASLNTISYGTRNLVLAMYDQLRAEFLPSNFELGLLTTVFMGVHAVMNIPFGWAGDRYDRRYVIVSGVILWSTANLIAGFTVDMGFLIASRAIAGLGTAAMIPVANALLGDLFSQEQKARVMSFFSLGVFVGGGFGFVAGSYLGFPTGFWVMSGLGLLFALFLASIPIAAKPIHPTAVNWSHFWTEARAVFRTSVMRWSMLGAIFSAFAAGGYLAWFIDFLTKEKDFTVNEATIVLGSLAMTGGLMGLLAGGTLGDWLAKIMPAGRLKTMAIGQGLAALCAVGVILTPRGVLFYALSWLLMFFIAWYHGPMAAVVDDLVPKSRAATAQAVFISVMHVLGTSSAPVAVGWLVGYLSVGQAFSLPSAGLCLAALCFWVAARRQIRTLQTLAEAGDLS